MSKKKIIIISSCIVLLIAAIVTTTILLLPKGNKNDNNEEIEQVTIMFDTDGGEEVSSIKIAKGEKITLPTTSKDGFNFLGWYNKDTKVNGDEEYTIDTILKAKWEEVKKENTKKEDSKKTFTVSFDSKGGTKVSSIKVECGKTLGTLPKPTKDAYIFVSWADKNGKVIDKGAKLSCENITLYANWEYDGPVANPEQEPIKTYTCPDGYKLEGTKCTQTVSAKEKCPDGTKVDGSLCIKTSDSNAGTRVCKEDTVSIDGKGHTWTGKGDYYLAGFGHCAYYKWTNITSQSDCTTTVNRRATWVSALNGCYAEVKNNNYDVVCSGDYQYYSSDELSSKFGIHDNGKCLKKVSKTKYCDSGYTLNVSNCVKTIDATLK